MSGLECDSPEAINEKWTFDTYSTSHTLHLCLSQPVHIPILLIIGYFVTLNHPNLYTNDGKLHLVRVFLCFILNKRSRLGHLCESLSSSLLPGKWLHQSSSVSFRMQLLCLSESPSLKSAASTLHASYATPKPRTVLLEGPPKNAATASLLLSKYFLSFANLFPLWRQSSAKPSIYTCSVSAPTQN